MDKKLNVPFYRTKTKKIHNQEQSFTPKCQLINRISLMTIADMMHILHSEVLIFTPFTKNSHSCLASISM